MSGHKTKAARLRLLGNATPTAVRDFVLAGEVTFIGRDPACDLVLNRSAVSRRHARIVRRSDGYYLEDLGSTGGTRLNGKPSGGPSCLKDGDHIEIAGCDFRFSSPSRADRRAEVASEAILALRDLSGTEEGDLAGIRPEEKLRALLEIGRDLVGTDGLEEVLARTLDALFRIFPQAERGFILLKSEGAQGLAPQAIKIREGSGGRPTMSRTIFGHVMLHGQAVLSEDVSTDDRFAGSRSVDEAQIRTMICVPLKDHQKQPVGILQLDTRDRQSRFTLDDLDTLVAVAGQVSAAIDNARLLEIAERERRRLAILAESGAVLASSFDLQATLPAVARLAVPQLADLCVIDLREEDGSIRRVAAAHADPAKQGLVDELRRFPPDPDGPHPAMQALRTNRPELSNSLPDQLLEGTARDPEHLALARQLGLHAYIVVPMEARGRTLGVVSLVATEPGRKFDPADLELAGELALRASQAIDNAALYREAQDARRRAEEAGRSKDLFLAMLSHELRTPFTPILAVASAHLEHEAESGLHPEWEMIRRNVVLEARLIDDLLDLSRIGRGEIRFDREVVDSHRTIQQAAEICGDELAAAGLAVILDLAASDHHVEADPARLMQIAWNLIRNAAKFTPGGGTLTIRTRNERSDERAAVPALAVEFEDTGLGIDPDVLPRIFDAFEQGPADSRRRASGLGLGLAISRSLAEALGGSLTARSAGRGLGATFRLELATIPTPAPAAEVPPSPPGARPRRSLRILVVEDNQDTLRSLASILGRRGYRIREAANLAEARAEASAGEFDLVLSDIELPDGTGLELMREVASHGLTGIAMSGYCSDDDIRESREAGFAEHLTKPVDVGKLEETIQQVTQALTL